MLGVGGSLKSVRRHPLKYEPLKVLHIASMCTVYIRKIRYWANDIEIIHSYKYALIKDAIRSVDIDTELDFLMVEFLIAKKDVII